MKIFEHLIIPTSSARHLFPNGLIYRLDEGARLVLPTPNKDGKFKFPDHEVYLRVPEIVGATHITIVHSAGYPDPNGSLMELFMLLNIIEQNAKTLRTVNVIFTCFAYGRQDNAYYPGELNGAKTILDMLFDKFGVERVFILDAHFANESWVSKKQVVNISAAKTLELAVGVMYPEAIFMAPDAGSTRRTNIKGAKKVRRNSFDVQVNFNKEFAKLVAGQVVCAVDDIIETGTTLTKFRDIALDCGAKKVLAAVTHGALNDGIERIQARFDGFYLTNSVNHPAANVPINGELRTLLLKSSNSMSLL